MASHFHQLVNGQFDLQYRSGNKGEKQAWYRERVPGKAQRATATKLGKQSQWLTLSFKTTTASVIHPRVP